ncbi:MAG: Integrase catalytic region [Clostridia bacterium]|jgi:transposase|nr:IS21 family transposase [Petroclostridium xylanilyticum]MBZ4646468.1 Integrase catalytic region [Clostridia bacterium]
MLTMTDIKYIKDLFEKKGLSLREITRVTGYNFRTVRKYIDQEDWSQPVVNRTREALIDKFKADIDGWLENDISAPRKQRHTAKRIFKKLKYKYNDEFNLSYRTVARYVSQKKKTLVQCAQGYIPLDHPAGEAQADFGEAVFLENGIRYEGYYVTMSFPYSNGGYIQLFKGANIECLLQGIKDIFKHMGKVPTCIWFDNDKTIVKKILAHGERKVTEAFARFQMHYGFESNFCNPDSGHEKGHVENKVGYSRRNMLVPVPEFKDIREFNRQLLAECDEDMRREHYKKDLLINNLFEEDKRAMRAIPKAEYEIYRIEKVKADKYGKLNFDNRKYSSGPQYAQRELMIKADAFSVVIMDEQYNTVQIHDRLYGEQKESMKWGPYLELMSRRPTALKYTGFFRELPQTLQDYLKVCDYEQKKGALRLLVKMLKQSELDTAIEAFRFCIERGIKDLDSIWAKYYTMVCMHTQVQDILLNAETPAVAPYTVDNAIYDNLLSGRCSACMN